MWLLITIVHVNGITAFISTISCTPGLEWSSNLANCYSKKVDHMEYQIYVKVNPFRSIKH